MGTITEHTKSAVVGYWRGGAMIETIMWIVGLPYWKVEKIIDDYKNSLT